jgi:acyl-CoA thioester hydrolase
MEAFVNNSTKIAPAAPQKSSKEPGMRYNYPRFRTITTRWMDNDVYGHVNNVVYYSFFDTAVNATLIDEGLLDPQNGDVIGLVVETGCRYASALSFPETVDAGIRVAHIGNSSVRFEVGLFKHGEDIAAAEGFFVHVYVDARTRRPTSIPTALRSFLESLT